MHISYPRAIEVALKQAGPFISLRDIDAVAVTKGPGLEICLRVGCRKAQVLDRRCLHFITMLNTSFKDIARELKVPFVTVHHLEAHCLLARLIGKEITRSTMSPSPAAEEKSTPAPLFEPKVSFPFLALLVSGGHTSILLCRGLGNYTVLGATLDDSLGEAFDKAARLLGLRTAGRLGLRCKEFPG